jgi:glucokinase
VIDIVIDFGGTNIKIGLISDGNILSQTRLPAYSENGILPRLPKVVEAITELLQTNAYMPDQCSGIGIALPGLVDPEAKTLLSINEKYADAVGFEFDRWAQDVFHLPIVIENDARAALIGEISYGSARGETDAVLIIFGTGIGTAAIMNGRVLRGKHQQAGVLGGHFSTDVHGETCNCGNLGCLEAQASHRMLSNKVKHDPLYPKSMLRDSESIGYQTIIDSYESDDPLSSRLLEDMLVHWSAGIVNLIHAYDPETVILSGGLMKSAHIILPLLEERVLRSAWTPWGKVRFILAKEPDASVLLGMSSLLQSARKQGGIHIEFI